MTILNLEQYHLAKFASWNHLRVSRYSSCRAFRFAWPFSPLQGKRLALVFRLFGNPEQRGRYPSQPSRFVLRQKWFLKWLAL